ncbi:DUF2892 domain-containing protein [Natrinema hispanicum]|uniref:Inner membrane protein YgaP-like transmembrane domain-containing protein n=1 Tax=Natrinema hispanicum TaxID=392421 RepID=A0A1I0C8F4_9EURY|nr:DUF2892 domain-containing protein [Natrinema hispanicum]SDD28481.1 Protein of unknown function [Natrinema hispanicum]SET15368.1 Protein of unknown function [Natrinema hispanicum]
MENNVGSVDRLVRLVGGAILIAIGIASIVHILHAGTIVGVIATLVGLVFFGTGVTRFCLLYQLLGVDTCKAP